MDSLVHVLLEHASSREQAPVYTELDRHGKTTQTLTFGRVQQKSAAVAATLQRLELVDRRVLLLMPQSMSFIVGFLGCLLARCVAVPHRLPKATDMERLLTIARMADIAAVLTIKAHEPRIRQLFDHSGLNVALVSVDEVDDALHSDWRMPDIGAATTALVQFTSGTIRSPKGVVVPHSALLHNSAAIREAFRFRGGEPLISWLPFTHDMGLIGHVVQPLYSSLHSIFLSPVAFATNPLCWLQAISDFRADCSGAPNFAYRLCSSKFTAESSMQLDLSSWRLAYCGAERIDADTMRTFIQKFRPHGFSPSSIFPCYGLAESTLFVTGRWGIAADRLTPASQEYVSVGPVANDRTTVKIVEPDTLSECADREIGEICIRSTSNASGYLNDAKATADAFDITIDGLDGFMRTGDLGYRDAGQLFVVGRMKDLIKIRGVAFAAEDAELVVVRTTQRMGQDILACAVTGIETESGEAALAFIELQNEISDARCSRDLSSRVARAVCDEIGILLEDVILVTRGELPKTPSGKVKRAACKDIYLSRRHAERAATSVEAR